MKYSFLAGNIFLLILALADLIFGIATLATSSSFTPLYSTSNPTLTVEIFVTVFGGFALVASIIGFYIYRMVDQRDYGQGQGNAAIAYFFFMFFIMFPWFIVGLILLMDVAVWGTEWSSQGSYVLAIVSVVTAAIYFYGTMAELVYLGYRYADQIAVLLGSVPSARTFLVDNELLSGSQMDKMFRKKSAPNAFKAR